MKTKASAQMTGRPGTNTSTISSGNRHNPNPVSSSVVNSPGLICPVQPPVPAPKPGKDGGQ